jgi:hypothetical protein
MDKLGEVIAIVIGTILMLLIGFGVAKVLVKG